MEKITLGISACLLGEPVRYDGGHKLDRFLRDTLGLYVAYVPVCPETECGLGVPREPMRLEGSAHAVRLVTRETRVDLTDLMTAWAHGKIRELMSANLHGFIFKSKSPSSGMERVPVFDQWGMPHAVGSGIFARIFMEHFPALPVEDDERLKDPVLLDNFMRRISPANHWPRI